MIHHQDHDQQALDKLAKEYNKLAALCLIFGLILGIVLGSVLHDWLYHVKFN